VDQQGTDTQFSIANYCGVIHDVTVNGGCLENNWCCIVDYALLQGTGLLTNRGNIGKIICIIGADAGMEEAECDKGYVDEGFSDNGAVDNGDWQDAPPLAEHCRGHWIWASRVT